MVEDSDEIMGLFDDRVFNSIQVEISITNSTTRTEFKKEPPIVIVEFSDEGIVIESPPKCCASNHSLLIKLRGVPPAGSPLEITATAKVSGVEAAQDGRERLSLSLIQVSETDWEKFKKMFSARQDEINNFLSSARGF